MKKNTKINPKEYKYRILEFLYKLSKEKYDVSKNVLPKKLGISERTFHRYIYVKADSEYQIPAEHLFQLANYFQVSMADMFTYEPEIINYCQLKKEYQKTQHLNFNV